MPDRSLASHNVGGCNKGRALGLPFFIPSRHKGRAGTKEHLLEGSEGGAY